MGDPVCILTIPTFKPGDPAPENYLAWHEWAMVQMRAGLRQTWCEECRVYEFPQERHEVGRMK
jgi:hypothetical protein